MLEQASPSSSPSKTPRRTQLSPIAKPLLEEEFSDANTKFEIPDEDAEKIVTVQDAVDYLMDRGVEGEG